MWMHFFFGVQYINSLIVSVTCNCIIWPHEGSVVYLCSVVQNTAVNINKYTFCTVYTKKDAHLNTYLKKKSLKNVLMFLC